MSYRKLDIWQKARSLVVRIHRLTLDALPQFEMYEEGAQIRRSIKSVKSNIVEGYGRRRYHADYVKFLVYAHASCDETVDHLETLFETGSLRSESAYEALHADLTGLSRGLHGFIAAVEERRYEMHEDAAAYACTPHEDSPPSLSPRPEP